MKFQNLIHIGAGNIESNKGTLIDLKTAKEENLISGKLQFDETMALYSKIRPYLKKIVKCDFRGLCSADIYPLTPFEENITKEFLYYLLSSNHFTNYAIEGSQRAGMPKVNRKTPLCISPPMGPSIPGTELKSPQNPGMPLSGGALRIFRRIFSPEKKDRRTPLEEI